jgi:uncharacterized lipoprotein YehR (DUF1307 family)
MKRAVVVMAIVLCLAGCSDDAPTIPDRPAFDEAVRFYLEMRGMQLKLVAYKTFSMGADRQTAEAELTLGYAGEAVKATKRFISKFENVNGEWRVTTLSPK